MIIDSQNEPEILGVEWDEVKREANIRGHGIDFVDAASILFQENIDIPSARNNEERRKATGQLNGRLVTVVYVRRGSNFRIISARRAWKSEERAYRSLYG